ncbi:cytochrome c oxidase subunit 6b-3-like [Quercus lobata]|uniref:cytochrome c oxidase subunit 6b-3-like n=1 Tax=Quercus lobata TaxID=97700 RepID=UPI001244C5FD|nr:cytochrome c oxidase subunit 6b-3-like [Quercus lobata]
MSTSSVVDPQDKMRAKDVNKVKVARGELAPRPAHEPGTVSRAPPPSQSHPSNNNNNREHKDSKDDDKIKLETAPIDARFPLMNQTRHCYTRYLEYHKCIQKKGKHAPECEKFADYYRSMCPLEWIQRWNEQRKQEIFPSPI